MKFWYFSECAYPYLPDEDTYDSVRVTLPNRIADPDVAARLWDRYLLEWQIADECGLDIQINEHHSTATCMNVTAPIVAGVLARETKNARILLLGNPVANRPDPVRVAEEMALVDVLSHGRLDVGFVRGVQYEISATNASPVRSTERLWEGIELITKAWTTHDGPFNWEGEFFHHRQVNIWPRPYQQPMPPVWVTAATPASIPAIADRGYRAATFLVGHKGARTLFQAYRDRCAETGAPAPGDDRFGYAALVYTGKTDEEGMEGAQKLLWYIHSNKVASQFVYPPGYMPYFARAAGLRGDFSLSPVPDLKSMSLEELMEHGVLFAGSAKSVVDQIERFNEQVGGFGHLLIMGQAGHLEHEMTVRGIRRFAEDVAPELARLTG
ncbi:Flavin-dependent oxidoreductase, luciferase family (includes alkanesulfonate monooxygenase SsuD and methylene tetrahydromethanopterin reductase) [Pseudonocardia thermophila]|uniref:Flavin-dependent oxidoreductase, luciferase family (Includes alkanesulfonate monooxygenase SsuD and methylene tetrahydromethanopterin reductase) n=1 Tax=Pseudonocardia thermophila TaxID=1848 RepID=A0A1M7BAH3_PSETH|nr:LLM class flavin-dependent oxidoreductase [Pseudonocardia thermophila]SHL51982.1 Flavin-dependent oxidoreductase, luciferase family (includes alkanesulfonate monooxygenase SsuD and methylene tetrahydromethanopterin reductase) [Pseudonocardia thermophila]